MGSSCSSAQKKKEKGSKRGLCVPDDQRRHSVLSTDSVPYSKGSPPNDRKRSDGKRNSGSHNAGPNGPNASGAYPSNAMAMSEELSKTEQDSTGPIKLEGTAQTGSSSPSGITITPNSACIGMNGAPHSEDASNAKGEGLPNLQQFPESVLNLLMGKVNEANVAPCVKEISVYVCAGYRDTIVERFALTEQVFPALRLHCAESGYDLRVVDLHWGQMGLYLDDHGYRDICIDTLQELKDKGSLIILLLLNDGMDHLPIPPRRIASVDFTQALQNLEEHGSSDETIASSREILLKWYSRDDNIQPVGMHVLKSVSSYLPNVVSNFEDERLEARESWDVESRSIVSALKVAFSEELRATYLSSVLEDEISRAVLDDSKMAKRCLWFQRHFTHLVQPSSDAEDESDSQSNSQSPSSVLDQVDANRSALLKVRLQEQLPDNQKIVFKVRWHKSNRIVPEESDDHAQYIEDICVRAMVEIQKMIDSMVEEDFLEEARQTYKGIEGALYDELQRQTTFCKIGASTFFHQEDLLEKLRHHVIGDSVRPLVLHAQAGGGKTALLCTAASRCCDWLPHAPVVFRLVGATPDAMTQEQLLRSVCEQCCALYGEHPSVAFKRFSQEDQSSDAPLMCLLQKPSSRRPLIILIDGLDRIAPHSARDLRWLPSKLPPHVRMILTVRDDSKELKALKDMLKDDECFVAIPPLDPRRYMDLVDNIVKRNQRSLTDTQRVLVEKRLQNSTPTPRYAYLIGHRVLNWRSDEEPEVTEIPQTTPLMVHETMAYLEGHLGVAVAAHIVGFLAASRYGLTESELLDLLSFQEEVVARALAHDPECAKVGRCPYLVWAVAKRRMKPLLRSTTVGQRTLVTWRCDAYRTLCQKRVGEDNWEACLQALLAYFDGNTANGKGLVLEQPMRFGVWPNRRKVDELPFCAFQLGDPVLHERFALGFDWLNLKLSASDPYCLLEDIEMCMQMELEEEEFKELSHLANALGVASYALRYDGAQLLSQLYIRLHPLMQKDESKYYPFLKELYALASRPSAPSLLPISFESPESLPEANEEKPFTALHVIKDNPGYMVSLSTKSGQVTVWDVYGRKPVRTLTGVFEPKDVQMVDGLRALVLCNRELKVYDLDEGCLVTKLKGVMNQKMAYFGLHDENYVVALSRNRMYVNMMNLKTGDLETTFKVGEDRFLNSLLVSANGRICVCGDETQKPFPLLVWELTNRKLLYDLRIPHHEFLTRMSAISHDGHYVVCVCREVDEGSTNFIIVYDLQSGTLFKKWKPESSSCSIAISSHGGCVINGLENTLLLVWDLVTGARRFNLQGHTAPVDQIKLDDEGARCLTYDSLGRDRSVRVWDIARGECIAVFTPDSPLTCGQLTSDGNAVVLGLQWRVGIVTYLICQDNSVEETLPEKIEFGRVVNEGKVFDVGQQG